MIRRILAVGIVLLGMGAVFFVVESERNDGPFPFALGLDLAGGTHLVYDADVRDIPEGEVEDSLASLREVVERRTNLFGVGEPLVQVEQSSFLADEIGHRLIVELPGVTDIDEAIAIIGETPLLEFRLANPEGVDPTQPLLEQYVATGISGRFIDSAELGFSQAAQGSFAGEPIVLVHFDAEGSERFRELTQQNVGEILAIFLDGTPISTPVIREEISGGTAQISGSFSPEEARTLVRDLNFGALPVPIELVSTQTIGPSLGKAILDDGLVAGLVGLGIVMLFMIAWYRVPGAVAALSLLFYVALLALIIKLIPITLTAAGIAGLILSIGMAVDANVLIFERMREELLQGKGVRESIRDGFDRAWLSIRDGNVSSLLAAIILFWFGTSIIEGFALVFALGIVVSMFSAIMVTRLILVAIAPEGTKAKALFMSGISL